MRGRVIALLVSVVVGVLGLAVASTVLAETAAQWTAEARLVVLPANADPAYEAVYYETLSRGQVVLTMAEVIRGTSSDAGGTTVRVHSVPDTSVIAITSTGGSALDVENAVADRLALGVSAVDRLGLPFQLTTLADGSGTTELVEAPGLSRKVVLFGAGLATGGACFWAMQLRTRRRSTR